MGNYHTLGRPNSLPVGVKGHYRSTSDPDLAGSTPNSPDNEVAGLTGESQG